MVVVVKSSSSVSSRAATKSNNGGCLDAFSAKKLEFLSRALPHLAVEDDDEDDEGEEEDDAAVAPLFCRPHFVDGFA